MNKRKESGLTETVESNGVNDVSRFLLDEALTERICSELEQLQYAQILTSLAARPLSDDKAGTNVRQRDDTLRSRSTANTDDADCNGLRRSGRRHKKPSRKIRELQDYERDQGNSKRSTRKTRIPGTNRGKKDALGLGEENRGKRNLGEVRGVNENEAVKCNNGVDEEVIKQIRRVHQVPENELTPQDGEKNITGNGKSGKERARRPPYETVGANEVDSSPLKKSRFTCSQCGKCFKTYYTYSIHVRMPEHTVETPFVCDTCGKGFRLSSTLCRHRIIHTSNKPHQCKVCLKNFNRSSTLKMHMRTHSSMKQHVCTECGKGFHQKGNLNNHMLVHSGERPFQCEWCGRQFNKKSNLKHHLKTHEVNGMLACTVCKTVFPRLELLREHMDMVHGR